jgi:phosphate:Na+ symporter
LGFALLAITGVGFLLSGLLCMRLGLKKILSGRIKGYILKMTVTPWRGLIVGALAAAILQSSTAVSLITIGLVSANYMTFYQSLGIILGANIGTCTTVQLLTLSIPQEFLISLLVLCILVAIVVKKVRYPAVALLGLLFMFLGLDILSAAANEISQSEKIIRGLIAAQNNPFLAIAGGTITTLVFQSSSAATGVLIVMAEEGLLDPVTAAYVVYGNNIGSCISSVIVGAAAPLAAKQVAAAHIMLNILGVLAFLPVTGVLTQAAAYFATDFAGQIAYIHTMFNILSSLLVMPFVRQYANLVTFLVYK